jgi:hypothetical protein
MGPVGIEPIDFHHTWVSHRIYSPTCGSDPLDYIASLLFSSQSEQHSIVASSSP